MSPSAGEAGEAMRQYGDASAVTQAFVLENANTKEVEQLIKPFLTQPGSNVVAVPRSNTLIVTDYATNLVKIAKWVESMDKPKALVTVQFVPVEHQAVADLTTQLTAVLAAKSRAGGAGEVTSRRRNRPRPHTNQLLVIGPQETVDESQRTGQVPRQTAGTDHQDLSIHQRAGLRRSTSWCGRWSRRASATDEYRSVTDDAENLMIVTAPDSVHEQIDELHEAPT